MSDRQAALGIDVGGTGTKGGIIDRSGNVLAGVEHPTDKNAGTKGILRVAEELLELAEDMAIVVTSVGVGAAGFIDARSGSIIFAPNLTYDDPNIADALRARVELPSVVDNDGNATVWGERAFGSAKGCDHLTLITLGTGIGSGFVIAGKLLRGSTGAGSELGHTVVDVNGPPCKCGLRGCAEQLASGQAIERMARAAAVEDSETSLVERAGSVDAITARHVAEAAGEGDEVATTVLRRAGIALGILMSNVANLFDPEVIVLSGSVAKAGEPFLGPARDQLARMTAAQRRRPLRIDITKLGKDAGVIGAAALAFDEAN
ncbi:MAG: ROK family protein [Actinobacteria bacterium]|nr:ROK family protein [Actinomycetota bacterium]